MSEQKQKRPAHKVIIEEMELALSKLTRALSDIDRGENAERDLIWAHSCFYTLLLVLGEMVIPENARQWVFEKLNGFADSTPRSSDAYEIRQIIDRL